MVDLLFSLPELRRLLRKRQGVACAALFFHSERAAAVYARTGWQSVSQSVRGGSDVIGAGVLQMLGTSQNNLLLHIDI